MAASARETRGEETPRDERVRPRRRAGVVGVNWSLVPGPWYLVRPLVRGPWSTGWSRYESRTFHRNAVGSSRDAVGVRAGAHSGRGSTERPAVRRRLHQAKPGAGHGY